MFIELFSSYKQTSTQQNATNQPVNQRSPKPSKACPPKRGREEGRRMERGEGRKEKGRGRERGKGHRSPQFGSSREWPNLDLSRSRDVIDHVTIRFATCHFQLVVHWNRVSISNRFRDIQPKNSCTHSHTDIMILKR